MTTEYIDMTKVSNEATLIVEDGALKTTATVSFPSSGLSVEITTNPVPISGNVTITTNPVPMSESWRAALTQDEGAGSNKVFTVPASTEWQLLTVWAELQSYAATVGNRQVEIQILDSASDVIGQLPAGAVQAASGLRNYLFAPGLPDLTSFRDTNALMTPMPPTFILAAGEKVRVWDNKAIASGLDTLNVQIKYAYRTV